MENKKVVNIISSKVDIDKNKVDNTIKLLKDGNTVPFIARYRKEATGVLDEKEIRTIKEEFDYQVRLKNRKEEVIRLIEERDELDEDLREDIISATIFQEVEDLYRPYKQKKRTRAARARKKGLKPLAELIWKQEIKEGKVDKFAHKYLDSEKELTSIDDVLSGAEDIIAEWISDDADIRKKIRELTFSEGYINSSFKNKEEDDKGKYKMYYEFSEQIEKIPPHRILALNRGEKEEVLRVKISPPEKKIFLFIRKKVIQGESIFKERLLEVIEDSYKRLIAPSISREIRNKLTEKAEEHAINVFSRNLKSILLQPPLKDKIIMGIDPGFRSGCKVCVIDETGKLLETATIYPHPPQNQKEAGEKTVHKMLTEYNVDAVAIGNGTACRETEVFISQILKKDMDVAYTVVNEAGASVYSASEIAREEFPELDVSMRGAVSIARRLQDPMAELVKIDPAAIGVGLYQHDINIKKLNSSLTEVVESAVNYVGVDINTASAALLQYVAGINSRNAQKIIEHREEAGEYSCRRDLKEVYGIGPKTFQQCAGFIRMFSEQDPLARTPIHPENYKETELIINELDYSVNDLTSKSGQKKIKDEVKKINVNKKSEELQIGVPTLNDIIKALCNPGRDPREKISGPIFKKNVLQMEDLEEGMVLQGTVRNVVDFGAFVDIGVKEDGLVHISELSNSYVEDPLNVVKAGENVKVKVLGVDLKRKRISLSMK